MGHKNGYRLFGFDYGFVGKTPETMIPFDLKIKGEKVSIARRKGENGKDVGCSFPIRFARTKNFNNRRLIPVYPLYDVLVFRGLILPFQSVLKQKEWAALPFEDGEEIKPIEA